AGRQRWSPCRDRPSCRPRRAPPPPRRPLASRARHPSRQTIAHASRRPWSRCEDGAMTTSSTSRRPGGPGRSVSAARRRGAVSWREELLMDAFPEGWTEIAGALEREFRCRDFAAAIEFVNRVAEAAEAANHHPDIEIRWNRVTLRWRTHSA